MKLAKQTHIGCVRQLNEDCCAVMETPELWVAVVADGMGGHNAGEVASRIAVDTVLETIAKGQGTVPQVTGAISLANYAVYDHSRSEAGCSGMGTTIVMACGRGNEALVANVGDSRAYHFSHKSETLRQVTRDHSLIEEMIAAGRMTREESFHHPFRNVITRAVGTAPIVSPDVFEVEMEAGDVLLLCSDGLTGHVPDLRIRDVLKKMKDPQAACEKLIEYALGGGGHDNITVAIVWNEGGEEQ